MGIYEDGTYLAGNPGWHEEDSEWKAGNTLKMLRRHDLFPARTVDIGCGAGEGLNSLSESGASCLNASFQGHEISPRAF